jgi:hypothetical protein
MTMILYQYLDYLPSIPQDMVEHMVNRYQEQKILFTVPERLTLRAGKSVKNISYTRYQLATELEQWIKTNVCEEFNCAGFQTQTPHLPGQSHLPHTDTWPRRWVLNYNLHTGGPKVTTQWYQEQGHNLLRNDCTRPASLDSLVCVESVQLEPCRWHILNTSVLHAVDNIETTRMTISLSFETEPKKLLEYDTQ